MSFDFLGTFNKSQFTRIAGYAQAQLPLIAGRIAHIGAEQSRLGALTMTRDTAGRPTGYAVSPSNSYLGRLVGAYEILGGDVLYDLQVRSITEPVYLRTGSETAASKFFSNGEPVPHAGLADAPTANLVTELRAWIQDTTDRREYLERKIRRCIDYFDQLQAEVTTLQSIQGAVTAPHSLAHLIDAVHTFLADSTYRPAIDDKGMDTFGKFAKAPLSSYEPGGERPAPDGEGVEKTESGYYIYGAVPGGNTGA